MPKPSLPETQVSPAPELELELELEKRTRRQFSTEYKRRIIAEADAYQYGELSAILRREGLYSNQLQQWHRELEQGGAKNLSKTNPDPKASKTPEQRLIEQLEKEKAQLKRKLQMTQDCVDLQKKPYRCWTRPTVGTTNDNALRQRPATLPLH